MDEALFDKFWNKYPKGASTGSRESVRQQFEITIKNNSSSDVVFGAARYAAHCQRMGILGTQWVKKPERWLKENCWTEEYYTPDDFKKKKFNEVEEEPDVSIRDRTGRIVFTGKPQQAVEYRKRHGAGHYYVSDDPDWIANLTPEGVDLVCKEFRAMFGGQLERFGLDSVSLQASDFTRVYELWMDGKIHSNRLPVTPPEDPYADLDI